VRLFRVTKKLATEIKVKVSKEPVATVNPELGGRMTRSRSVAGARG
jgi:hypothetical protein